MPDEVVHKETMSSWLIMITLLINSVEEVNQIGTIEGFKRSKELV